MADRIIVLAEGRVLENGTHQELMALARPLRRTVRAAGGGLPLSQRNTAVSSQRQQGPTSHLALNPDLGPSFRRGDTLESDPFDCTLWTPDYPLPMPDPLLTTTYTLTRADALAYERWARRPTLRGTIGFVLWLALAGVVLWFLPDSWTGTYRDIGFWALGAVFVTIQYVLAMIVSTIGEMRRARRQLRQPHDVTIEEHADRLDVSGIGIPRTLSFAEAGAPTVTRTHLFLGRGDDLVILPRSAFAEEGSFDALVARLSAAAIAAVAVDRGEAEGISPGP